MKPPKIDNAPGLVWRPRVNGWEARWQARTDLVRAGFLPKSARLWAGAEPSEAVRRYISDRCSALQAEMLVWSRKDIAPKVAYDGTWRGLIGAYQTDEDTPYRGLRYKTRQTYDSLCRRILATPWGRPDDARLLADVGIAEVRARDMLRIHKGWIAQGHVTMGHSLITMVRALASFGATILDDPASNELSRILGDMRFTSPRPNGTRITTEQVNLIRIEAHRAGLPSIALAQAIQYDCILRQKDVIGEWVPMSEPGLSDITAGNEKWIRGVRWEEVDANFVMRHVTSKRQKLVEVPWLQAPMIVEELKLAYPGCITERMIERNGKTETEITGRRDLLPANGPVISSELVGAPFTDSEFRRQWRKLADACGIPKAVKNMHSRSGAITEALIATEGDLDAVRVAATHSNVSTTVGYSRGDAERTAEVLKIRAKSRQKSAE